MGIRVQGDQVTRKVLFYDDWKVPGDKGRRDRG